MSVKKLALALAIASIFVAASAAQSAPAAQALVLEFVDGEELTVVYPDSTTYSYASGSVQEGDKLPVGSTVKTGATTTAELKIAPNGTVIKLAKKTTFKVEGLATPEKDQNAFTLASGKIRAVAAKGGQYSIYTANTVAGVRGTDFSMAFEEGTKATLLVAKGLVEFGRREGDAMADAIKVGAGQMADFFKGMTAAPYTPEQLAEEYDGLDIDPAKMPPQPEEAKTEDKPAASGPSDSAAAAAVTPPPAEAAPAESKDAAADKVESAVFDWLRDILGMEIGSITINGDTWAKAVIQPTFTLGKLKAGLYLPVIYSDNLFDPSTWYRPSGNDEWSFGTDIGWTAEDWPSALLDAATDVALKIKFIEYGQPLEDPFFIKVGNVDSFTIGHGLLMRDYANDADFPSIRRVGLNLGLDFGKWGFEALSNDLTDNEILGGRFFFRPVEASKIAVGFSGVADLNPASVFNTEAEPDAAALYGDPAFIGAAADLDIPVVSSDLLGIRFFADAGAMVPYVRNEYSYEGATGASGLRFDMITDTGSNWGAASGLIANILFVNLRLEYRYFTGAFSPAFFDSSYERRRSELVKEWASYLTGATVNDQLVMGVYGEGGASIIKDKLVFELGYFWPWAAGATTLDEQLSTSDDYLKASLVVKKGLVPVIDVAGALSYERRNFARTLAGQVAGASLFDENTTFSGELSFPVPGAPNLDLAFIFSTTVERDGNGDVVYIDEKPSIVPAITLETRLHF